MYIIKKHEPFQFAVEDSPEEIFSLPTMSNLSFDDAKAIATIEEDDDIAVRGRAIKEFIVSYNPGIEDLDIGDFEFFYIYNAWRKHEGAENKEGAKKLGES